MAALLEIPHDSIAAMLGVPSSLSTLHQVAMLDSHGQLAESDWLVSLQLDCDIAAIAGPPVNVIAPLLDAGSSLCHTMQQANFRDLPAGVHTWHTRMMQLMQAYAAPESGFGTAGLYCTFSQLLPSVPNTAAGTVEAAAAQAAQSPFAPVLCAVSEATTSEDLSYGVPAKVLPSSSPRLRMLCSAMSTTLHVLTASCRHATALAGQGPRVQAVSAAVALLLQGTNIAVQLAGLVQQHVEVIRDARARGVTWVSLPDTMDLLARVWRAGCGLASSLAEAAAALPASDTPDELPAAVLPVLVATSRVPLACAAMVPALWTPLQAQGMAPPTSAWQRLSAALLGVPACIAAQSDTLHAVQAIWRAVAPGALQQHQAALQADHLLARIDGHGDPDEAAAMRAVASAVAEEGAILALAALAAPTPSTAAAKIAAGALTLWLQHMDQPASAAAGAAADVVTALLRDTDFAAAACTARLVREALGDALAHGAQPQAVFHLAALCWAEPTWYALASVLRRAVQACSAKPELVSALACASECSALAALLLDVQLAATPEPGPSLHARAAVLAPVTGSAARAGSSCPARALAQLARCGRLAQVACPATSLLVRAVWCHALHEGRDMVLHFDAPQLLQRTARAAKSVAAWEGEPAQRMLCSLVQPSSLQLITARMVARSASAVEDMVAIAGGVLCAAARLADAAQCSASQACADLCELLGCLTQAWIMVLGMQEARASCMSWLRGDVKATHGVPEVAACRWLAAVAAPASTRQLLPHCSSGQLSVVRHVAQQWLGAFVQALQPLGSVGSLHPSGSKSLASIAACTARAASFAPERIASTWLQVCYPATRSADIWLDVRHIAALQHGVAAWPVVHGLLGAHAHLPRMAAGCLAATPRSAEGSRVWAGWLQCAAELLQHRGAANSQQLQAWLSPAVTYWNAMPRHDPPEEFTVRHLSDDWPRPTSAAATVPAGCRSRSPWLSVAQLCCGARAEAVHVAWAAWWIPRIGEHLELAARCTPQSVAVAAVLDVLRATELTLAIPSVRANACVPGSEVPGSAVRALVQCVVDAAGHGWDALGAVAMAALAALYSLAQVGCTAGAPAAAAACSSATATALQRAGPAVPQPAQLQDPRPWLHAGRLHWLLRIAARPTGREAVLALGILAGLSRTAWARAAARAAVEAMLRTVAGARARVHGDAVVAWLLASAVASSASTARAVGPAAAAWEAVAAWVAADAALGAASIAAVRGAAMRDAQACLPLLQHPVRWAVHPSDGAIPTCAGRWVSLRQAGAWRAVLACTARSAEPSTGQLASSSLLADCLAAQPSPAALAVLSKLAVVVATSEERVPQAWYATLIEAAVRAWVHTASAFPGDDIGLAHAAAAIPQLCLRSCGSILPGPAAAVQLAAAAVRWWACRDPAGCIAPEAVIAVGTVTAAALSTPAPSHLQDGAATDLPSALRVAMSAAGQASVAAGAGRSAASQQGYHALACARAGVAVQGDATLAAAVLAANAAAGASEAMATFARSRGAPLVCRDQQAMPDAQASHPLAYARVCIAAAVLGHPALPQALDSLTSAHSDDVAIAALCSGAALAAASTAHPHTMACLASATLAAQAAATAACSAVTGPRQSVHRGELAAACLAGAASAVTQASGAAQRQLQLIAAAAQSKQLAPLAAVALAWAAKAWACGARFSDARSALTREHARRLSTCIGSALRAWCTAYARRQQAELALAVLLCGLADSAQSAAPAWARCLAAIPDWLGITMELSDAGSALVSSAACDLLAAAASVQPLSNVVGAKAGTWLTAVGIPRAEQGQEAAAAAVHALCVHCRLARAALRSSGAEALAGASARAPDATADILKEALEAVM